LPLTVATVLPGGTPMTRGSIFQIEREGDSYAAVFKGQTMIYPCFGAQDAESEESLKAAMAGAGHDKVRRLRRSADVPIDTCWAKGPGWALTYA
jgi:hypothetical protein